MAMKSTQIIYSTKRIAKSPKLCYGTLDECEDKMRSENLAN
jgi:hypothetical protein